MDEVKSQTQQIEILSSILQVEQEIRKKALETGNHKYDGISEMFQNQQTDIMKIINNFEVEASQVQKLLVTLSEISQISLQQEKAERHSELETLRNEMKNLLNEFLPENLEKLKLNSMQTVHKRLRCSESETDLNAQ